MLLAAAFCAPVAAAVPPPAAAKAPIPADAWPRQINLSGAAVLVYAPQVTGWVDGRIDFRSAVAIKPAGARGETFGVVTATARTRVDRVTRLVSFDGIRITNSDFPALPDRGAGYAAELQAQLATVSRTITLDRLQASLHASGFAAPTVAVQNDPPRVIVSTTPAILVPIAGAPVWKPVPGAASFQRLINTRALMLKSASEPQIFMKVYDGWLMANALDGPWTQPFIPPAGIDAVAKQVAATGVVDVLDGGPRANPRPSLAQGIPAVYTSQVPAELVVFEGAPEFAPIVGTGLMWATNTTGDVLRVGAAGDYYVLLAGRWFRSAALTGPWSFVASNALPPDFAKIPPTSLAGAVLSTVAGTPQAQEAAIEIAIPQTATVPLKNGPTFTATYDGAAQFVPVPGTSLSRASNSRVPVIQTAPGAYYAVRAGIWFTAAQPTGPWSLATSVPASIYAIPPSSPIFHVTYVKIYGATPDVVYAGYTPGYLGANVAPTGNVVFGTGYAYPSWIGDKWYAAPPTYGVGATPVYNPRVGYTYAFAVGLATVAWQPPAAKTAQTATLHPSYWGGYPCCGTASANVYRVWARDVQSKSRAKDPQRADGPARRAAAAAASPPAGASATAASPPQAAAAPGNASSPPVTRTALERGGAAADGARAVRRAYAAGAARLRHVDGDGAGQSRRAARRREAGAAAVDFRQRVLRESQGERRIRSRLGREHRLRRQHRRGLPQRGQRLAAARRRRLAEHARPAARSQRAGTGADARGCRRDAGGLVRHEQRDALFRRSQRRLERARLGRRRLQPHARRRRRHQRRALCVQHGRAQQRIRHRGQRRLVGAGRLHRWRRLGRRLRRLTASRALVEPYGNARPTLRRPRLRGDDGSVAFAVTRFRMDQQVPASASTRSTMTPAWPR